MKPFLVLAATLLAACTSTRPAPIEPVGQLVHSVYFVLKEDTPELRSALVRDCLGLRSIAGVVSLRVGPRAEEFVRESNDLEFDIALQVVFRDRAAHDLYQIAAQHQALLATWVERLESVRVFDSWALGF